MHCPVIIFSTSHNTRKKIWTSLEEPLYSFTCDGMCKFVHGCVSGRKWSKDIKKCDEAIYHYLLGNYC